MTNRWWFPTKNIWLYKPFIYLLTNKISKASKQCFPLLVLISENVNISNGLTCDSNVLQQMCWITHLREKNRQISENLPTSKFLIGILTQSEKSWIPNRGTGRGSGVENGVGGSVVLHAWTFWNSYKLIIHSKVQCNKGQK